MGVHGGEFRSSAVTIIFRLLFSHFTIVVQRRHVASTIPLISLYSYITAV